MLQGQLFQKIMESYAVGTAQLNFGPTHLQQIKIPCPPIKIAMEYEKIMEPIEEEIKILRDKNVYLKNMKNIILPRLMTGKIDINSLKI